MPVAERLVETIDYLPNKGKVLAFKEYPHLIAVYAAVGQPVHGAVLVLGVNQNGVGQTDVNLISHHYCPRNHPAFELRVGLIALFASCLLIGCLFFGWRRCRRHCGSCYRSTGSGWCGLTRRLVTAGRWRWSSRVCLFVVILVDDNRFLSVACGAFGRRFTKIISNDNPYDARERTGYRLQRFADIIGIGPRDIEGIHKRDGKHDDDDERQQVPKVVDHLYE